MVCRKTILSNSIKILFLHIRLLQFYLQGKRQQFKIEYVIGCINKVWTGDISGAVGEGEGMVGELNQL